MTRELNWVFDSEVSLVNSTTYLTLSRAFAYYLKNQLVALGGYEVVGSSANSGAQWEYEGTTAGSSYGGGSTGPYDVWTADTDIDWAADGSSPSFVVLKSPLWEGKRMYLLLGLGSSSSYYADFWYVATTEMPALVDGAIAYYPIASTDDTEWVSWTEARVYYSTGDFVVDLSVCPDNGSFFLASRRSTDTRFTGFVSAVRMDPASDSSLAIGVGQASNFDSVYSLWWHCPVPKPQPWGDGVNPLIADPIATTWAEPMRGTATAVMTTDLNTVNCFGKAEGFPFYMMVGAQVGGIEYKMNTLGRVIDLFVAPYGLSDGDTVGDGGSIEYYVFANWMIPGNTAPVL